MALRESLPLCDVVLGRHCVPTFVRSATDHPESRLFEYRDPNTGDETFFLIEGVVVAIKNGRMRRNRHTIDHIFLQVALPYSTHPMENQLTVLRDAIKYDAITDAINRVPASVRDNTVTDGTCLGVLRPVREQINRDLHYIMLLYTDDCTNTSAVPHPARASQILHVGDHVQAVCKWSRLDSHERGGLSRHYFLSVNSIHVDERSVKKEVPMDVVLSPSVKVELTAEDDVVGWDQRRLKKEEDEEVAVSPRIKVDHNAEDDINPK
ncbi:hypothetical protein B0H10DRAFT_2221673 [Mycena sp. CBHHK59/15]|nr:hypothetical protein B0H10DRAFT_2221673 [Mycena sp. CBHHK59/15]